MKLNKKYKGLSLIEMLITLAILTVVILLTSVTLTTLIKTSAVTSARSIARQESEFVIELIRRNVRNSHSDDVKLYSVKNRVYNEELDKLVDNPPVEGYSAELAEDTVGTEIHFRPFGYDRWICIGYFPTLTDATRGYVIKSSYPNNSTPQNCFDSSNSEYIQNGVILNSSEVYASQFQLQYYKSTSGNLLIAVAVEMKSKYEMSFARDIKPSFFKQALVSTQKLTWEK